MIESRARRTGSASRTIAVVIAMVALVAVAVAFAFREFLHARRSEVELVRLRVAQGAAEALVASLTAETRANGVSRVPAPASTLGEPLQPREVSQKDVPVSNWEKLRDVAGVADINRDLAFFFHRQGINGDDARRVTSVMVRHNRIHVGLIDAAPTEARSDPESPAVVLWAVGIEAEKTRFLAELESVLGPEGFKAYERYQTEKPHWQTVTAVAVSLYESDTPLTGSQAARLGEILIAHSTNGNGKVTRSVSDWEEVFRAAQEILSPAQIEMLKFTREHDQLFRQMNRLRAQAMQQAGR